MANNIHMLTTVDNPFNPFKHFDEWKQYDESKGYNSISYLGRIVDYTGCYSERQREEERERAIDQIVTLDPTGIYCKVTENEVVHPIQV